MKLIVQSFSDIITNSSSEVFVSTINDSLIEALKQLNYPSLVKHECIKGEDFLENWEE